MAMSNKFKNATKHLFDIIMIMIDDKGIYDYLVYGKDKGKNIDLFNNYVIPNFPNIDKLPDDYKTRIYVNPDTGRDYRGDKATMQEIYKVDILVPDSEVLTRDGELRAFGIAYEMAKNIDNKNITGIGKSEIFDYKYYKLGDNHVALTFFIQNITQKKTVM